MKINACMTMMSEEVNMNEENGEEANVNEENG